jgi:putative hemolysin
MKTIIRTLLIAIIAASCSQGSAPSDSVSPTTSDSVMGVANPASQYCLEQGGELDLVDETAGQVGYCILPDGTRIEEWELFNSQSTTTTNS